MSNLVRLLSVLQNTAGARRHPVQPAGLEPGLARLRAWQTWRLERTYADLLAQEQFAPTCRFFLDEIYAPRDFSQRDQDAENLHDLLARFLPASMLRVLSNTIRLNRMTARLDQDLNAALAHLPDFEGAITRENYARAYRLCDNLTGRRAQIDLLVEILAEVCEAAHFPATGITLRLARHPAQHAGWQDLYEFLHRGHQAASHMRDVKYFVGVIRRRETGILEAIFAGEPAPFAPYLPEG